MQGLTAASSRRRLASGALPLSKGDLVQRPVYNRLANRQSRETREREHTAANLPDRVWRFEVRSLSVERRADVY